ncbi:N-acetylglucosamine kinase [Aminobacter niigataensis]|uniref:N-acetylglucosamine kinase n=1 Tax=Aminobacter niigataensis TaxID=83265 RepID=UPI0024C692FB|nr:N-acetylglucosamine kinase [Aminobacter niigataensis]CAI2931652.1 N-acetylglucosamine kinase of eukaryotic type [Aminobacter niigataensis]
MDLVLGIDGGGTGCRAALASATGDILGRGRGGPANIRTDLAGACENIVEAARLAFADAGRDPALIGAAGAVLGLAGANVGDYKQRLQAMLPFRNSRIENDSLISLEGALGEHDGAIAALGTGTVYLARQKGHLRPVGGWGFQIGDLGSGARIGRDLLQETLLVHDKVHAGTPLADIMLERFNRDPSDIVEFTTAAKPGDYGAFAPMVFEHAAKGDALGQKLVERAVADVEETLAVFDLAPTERLCLLGGLAGLYAPLLSKRYRAIMHPPLQDALGGAVAMAARTFGKAGGGHG